MPFTLGFFIEAIHTRGIATSIKDLGSLLNKTMKFHTVYHKIMGRLKYKNFTFPASHRSESPRDGYLAILHIAIHKGYKSEITKNFKDRLASTLSAECHKRLLDPRHNIMTNTLLSSLTNNLYR